MEKITYHIDTEKNIIFTRVEGKITLFNLLIHMNKVESDKKFKKGLNTLVDLTEAFINMNFEELPQLTSHLREKEKIRGGCKWAVLHKDKMVFKFVSIILSEINLSKIKIKLFRNKQEALEWLSF